VLSITASNVRKNANGTYTIYGLKGRSGQFEEDILEEMTDDEWEDIQDDLNDREIADVHACKAIDLLLWQDSNIPCGVVRTSQSLFVTLNLQRPRPYRFELIQLNLALDDFCNLTGLPEFAPNQIRAQVFSIEYLRTNGDLHYVSALLNHANLETTHRYANSTIIRALAAANMKRFMDHLGASIVFVCGGEARVRELGLNPDYVREQMLFPPSAASPESQDSESDKWLNAVGELKIYITEAEIAHCAMQHTFYKKSFRALIQANEDRFRHYHFPRIMFCQALYMLIEQSQYRQILRNFDGVYDD
jgi:hypothetical protein